MSELHWSAGALKLKGENKTKMDLTQRQPGRRAPNDTHTHTTQLISKIQRQNDKREHTSEEELVRSIMPKLAFWPYHLDGNKLMHSLNLEPIFFIP